MNKLELYVLIGKDLGVVLLSERVREKFMVCANKSPRKQNFLFLLVSV